MFSWVGSSGTIGRRFSDLEWAMSQSWGGFLYNVHPIVDHLRGE